MGGYFSPQAYFLANVPITWTGHYLTRWHYTVLGSFGVQAFSEDTEPLCPTRHRHRDQYLQQRQTRRSHQRRTQLRSARPGSLRHQRSLVRRRLRRSQQLPQLHQCQRRLLRPLPLPLPAVDRSRPHRPLPDRRRSRPAPAHGAVEKSRVNINKYDKNHCNN
jgi:hypothetical protein